MARDAALVTTWGVGIPGREGKGLEVFMDAVTFWGKQAADGRCSPPEVMFAEDGSNGMLIVRGRSDALREIIESEEGEKLIAKAQMIVQDLKSHWYYTGDEEMQRGTRIFAEAGNELGYI
jgi:hypothetical protein